MKTLSSLILLLFVPLLAFAQEGGDTVLVQRDASTCAATTFQPIPPRTAVDSTLRYSFSSRGFLPHKLSAEDRMRNIPKELHVDWGRRRERFIPELIDDIVRFVNAFDTTYIQRNRFKGMLFAKNVNFFQRIRLSAQNDAGVQQSLTLAPAHAVKVGPLVGWGPFVVGYTFGVVSDHYRSRSSEYNIAAYNSKVGFDLNYIHSRGNFNIRKATGFEGIDRHSIRGARVEAMTSNLLALNFYYVLNHRHFSYPAALSMSTVQLKSAGSWLIGLRFDRQRLHFDAEKIETLLKSINPQAKMIDELKISSLHYRQGGISLGYAYNWVPAKGWLISAGATPSLGFKYQKGEGFNTATLRKNIRNFQMDFIFRGGIVHSNGRHYIGASWVNYLYDYRDKGLFINNSINYLTFYAGIYLYRMKNFRIAGKSKW